MRINPSLSPLPARLFKPAHAWHLLQRAGFGPDAAALDRALADGLPRTVDRLMDFNAVDPHSLNPPEVDPDVRKPLNREQRMAYRRARRAEDEEVLEDFRQRRQEANQGDRQMINGLRQWWLDRMVRTPLPLQEKLTLMWHDHFATSYRSVRDAYLIYRQNELLRAHACGDFAELALGVVRDPAMLKYLNNNQNRKQRPNENLAREFMELFTLGEGRYTERDIKEAARALTGYTFHDNDFVFRENWHDPETKTILGLEKPYDGAMFVRRLLAQKACSEFVALKLYRHLVADVPDEPDQAPDHARGVIERLGKLIRDEKYDLRPVVRTLLLSQHFHDANHIGQKIKSPVHFAVGLQRMLGGPKRNLRPIGYMLHSAGQTLFAPPSVDGWAGGEAWINTSTLFLRQNLAAYLVTNHRRGASFNVKRLGYDPLAVVGDLGDEATPTAYAHRAVDLMLGPHVQGPTRRAVVDHASRADKLTPELATSVLLLLTAAPEYQLC